MDQRGHDNPLHENYAYAGDYQYMALPHYGLAPFYQTPLLSPRSLPPLPAIPSNRIAPFHQPPVHPIYWQRDPYDETTFSPQIQQQQPQQPRPHPQQQVVVVDKDDEDDAASVESFWCEIVFSCLVLWFCNILFGLVAFILAMVASKNSISDREHSSRLGRISLGLSACGIVFTLIAVIIAIGVVFGVLQTGTNNNSTSSSDNSSSSGCTYTQRGQCYKNRSFSYQYNSCYQMGGYFGSDGYCYYN